MELSVIFVYFGRRCWCHWTLTSQGEERQAAESKPGFLRLKVAVICVHGSWAQLQPGCVQGRARGPQPLGDMIKMQAELPFLWLCPLALSSLQGGKKFWGKKKTLPEGPLWTQCQPETAADGEQQHQGPTVPSCPASSTPERTVKRPRVGEQPTRTKELAAGKTTWALSNSSQNNPFPRVSRSGEGEKI